jgi:hypothetical protein
MMQAHSPPEPWPGPGRGGPTAYLKHDALIDTGSLTGTIRLRDVYAGLDLTEGQQR